MHRQRAARGAARRAGLAAESAPVSAVQSRSIVSAPWTSGRAHVSITTRSSIRSTAVARLEPALRPRAASSSTSGWCRGGRAPARCSGLLSLTAEHRQGSFLVVLKLFGDSQIARTVVLPHGGRDPRARSSQPRRDARASCCTHDGRGDGGGRRGSIRPRMRPCRGGVPRRLSRLAGDSKPARPEIMSDFWRRVTHDASAAQKRLDPRRDLGHRAGLCAPPGRRGRRLVLVGRNEDHLTDDRRRSQGPRRGSGGTSMCSISPTCRPRSAAVARSYARASASPDRGADRLWHSRRPGAREQDWTARARIIDVNFTSAALWLQDWRRSDSQPVPLTLVGHQLGRRRPRARQQLYLRRRQGGLDRFSRVLPIAYTRDRLARADRQAWLCRHADDGASQEGRSALGEPGPGRRATSSGRRPATRPSSTRRGSGGRSWLIIRLLPRSLFYRTKL